MDFWHLHFHKRLSEALFQMSVTSWNWHDWVIRFFEPRCQLLLLNEPQKHPPLIYLIIQLCYRVKCLPLTDDLCPTNLEMGEFNELERKKVWKASKKPAHIILSGQVAAFIPFGYSAYAWNIYLSTHPHFLPNLWLSPSATWSLHCKVPDCLKLSHVESLDLAFSVRLRSALLATGIRNCADSSGSCAYLSVCLCMFFILRTKKGAHKIWKLRSSKIKTFCWFSIFQFWDPAEHFKACDVPRQE